MNGPDKVQNGVPERLNAIKRDLSNPVVRPRDAASLIILDTDGGTARLLLGRRHAGQAFVPDKYVFPGGGSDACDRRVPTTDALDARDITRLISDMKGKASAARAQALALTAIRETFEETGILIGHRPEHATRSRLAGWKPFFDTGAMPLLGPLKFVARAITPPGRTRRYDTRFFCCSARYMVGKVGNGDGEFTELLWVTFDEARALDLHPMTRTIIDDVAECLQQNGEPDSQRAVPYYVFKGGAFRRELIA